MVARLAVRAIGLILILAASAVAQVQPAPSVRVQDEGGAAAPATALNCVGASIVCAVSASTATLTVTAVGGSANFFKKLVVLNNGGSGGDTGPIVYSVAPGAWFDGTQTYLCGPYSHYPATDAMTVEELSLARLSIAIGNEAGAPVTNLSVAVTNLYGAIGRFYIHCTGG